MARQAERSFVYQRRPAENVRERANMRGGDFDSIFKPEFKVFKTREGKNLVRVLPPTWEGAKHYGLDIYVNYGVGVDNQSYLSLSKMKASKDPLAEARQEAEREGDEKTAKALRPKHRVLMWLIDRLAEDEGPQLWAPPFGFDKDVATQCYDEDTKEILYIDDPDEGYDFRFYREGQGMLTKYPPGKMKVLAASPLHEDPAIKNDWLDFVKQNPLPSCLQYYSYEHIAGIFNGQVRTESAGDAASEKPRKPAVAEDDDPPPRHKKPAPVDEAEEPPFERPRRPEPVDEEAREAELPRRRPRATTEDEDAPRQGESIRERLQRSRSRATASAEDD